MLILKGLIVDKMVNFSVNVEEHIKKEIIKEMYDTGQILTWYRDRPEGWRLASGLWSPLYINERSMPSNPRTFQKAVEALGSMLIGLGYRPYGKDKVVGLAMAGVPFASALSAVFGFPALYTRKLPEEVKTGDDVERYIKSHGQHALVEGELNHGDRLVMIDDLVTRFDSKLLAMGQINGELLRRNISGTSMKDIVVLIDREQGGVEKAEACGYGLHSVIRFKSEGLGLLKNSISDIEYSVIAEYLSDGSRFQNKEIQDRLREAAMKKEIKYP